MRSQSLYAARMPGPVGDVINQLNGLRPLIRMKSDQLIALETARISTNMIDILSFMGGGQINVLQQASNEIKRRASLIDLDGVPDPAVDTRFDVILIDDREYTIMISYTEHLDWFQDLLSLPGTSDYSYWDGAPQPEGVSDEDWALRRRTFARLLSRDPHGRPMGCGIQHSFLPSLDPAPVALVLDSIPAQEDRVSAIIEFARATQNNVDQGELLSRIGELPEVTEGLLLGEDPVPAMMQADTPEL